MPLVKFNPVLLIAALVVAAVTARLGWWQLDRAAQKEAIQRSLDERRALPVLRQAQAPVRADAVPAVQDRLVQLQGRWLPEHQVLLDNRPMSGRTGFYVVMPLLLADGTAVVVQRGWLPRHATERTRIAPFETPAGPVDVQGRIAPALARLYEFEAAASGTIRQNLDLDPYAQQTRLQLRPWVVVQQDPATADGLLRQWSAPAAGVHTHYGYAFQWFSLSALTLGLYVWFQLIRPYRSRSR